MDITTAAVAEPVRVVVIAALAAMLGALAGAGARRLVGRLHRGAQVRPPGCEGMVGVLWALVAGAWAAGMLPSTWVPALFGLAWLGVAAGVVDLHHHRLPDALTLPAVPAVLLLVVPLGPASLGRAAAGAVLAVAVHAAVHLAAPRSLGGGDVKLAAPLGAVLGAVSWPALVAGAVLAALFTALGAVLGSVVAVARGRSPTGGGVAHGPSMALATWVVAAAAAVGGGG